MGQDLGEVESAQPAPARRRWPAIVVLAVFVLPLLGSWLTHALPRRFLELTADATGWITSSHVHDPPPSLADLPVRISVPNAGVGLAVILSGNAGWWAIDDTLADALTSQGWTVAGLNSLSLFRRVRRIPHAPRHRAGPLTRNRRSPPGRPARRSGRLQLRCGCAGGHLCEFAGGRPPGGQPRRAPGALRHADYAIGASLLFNGLNRFGRDVVDAVRRIPDGVPVCIAGQDQGLADSSCNDPSLGKVATVTLPGGHHFGGNYAVLTQIAPRS